MNEMAKTDKVLSRKEARRRLRRVQQSRAPQRDVARHVGRDGPHHGGLRRGRLAALRRAHAAPATRPSCPAPTSRASARSARTRRRSRTTTRRPRRRATRCYAYPKPTIAMIRGYCIGGGLGIAMCCDLRIASDNSTLRGSGRQARPRLRPMPGVKRLVDVVGPSFAKEIFYTARQFDAEEAQHHGPDQSRGAGRRARELREEICRDDRRQCAADHQGGEEGGRRDRQGPNPSATWRAPTRS